MQVRNISIFFVVLVSSLVIGAGTSRSAPIRSLVINGGFEHGLAGWIAPRAATVARKSGGECLVVHGPGTVRQDVYAKGLSGTFTAAVDIKASSITPSKPSGYAYAAVYQTRRDGALVAFHDFAQIRTAAARWQRLSWTFQVAPRAEIISLRCGIFNATGTAWFDNWTLVPGARAATLAEVREAGSCTGSERGRIAVFREPGFPVGPGAAKPEAMAEWVRPVVDSVEFIDAKTLADPSVLRPDRFDLVILPYGESFPGPARDALVRYLHAGGDFLSVGGYAFSTLYYPDGKSGWIAEAQFVAEKLARAMAPANSLLWDGGFETPETREAPPTSDIALDGKWRRSSKDRCRIVTDSPRERNRCAQVVASSPVPELRWELRVPARQGRRYRVRAAIRTRDVAGPGFAYLAIYQYSETGDLVKSKDFAQIRGTTPWKGYHFDLTPESRTRTLYIKCGLYRASGTAWFDGFRLAEITGCQAVPMNTRTGIPKDGLNVAPDQIGVFDADYRLERVRQVVPATGQNMFFNDAHQSVGNIGPVRGWAASGVRGEDRTRWVPLLTAVDRYGRNRGAAAALLRHYSGFFSGSSWAIFGVDDRDLFAKPTPGFALGLQRLVRNMVRGVYLHNLETDFASYELGAEVRLRVTVENAGCRVHHGHVEWAMGPAAVSPPRRFAVQEYTVAPGSQVRLEQVVRLDPPLTGLCRVTASTVVDRESGVEDRMQRGFVVLNEAATPNPSALTFRDNYLRLGKRPIFLFGSDNYSNVYTSSAEGPLWWQREHRASRDFGFEIYENLQYSNSGHRMTELDWRRFQAMAWLTQKHSLVFMPGTLIGHNVAVSDAEIAAESRQCTEYARKLSKTPRLLWYINGDYQLRHDDKSMLKEKWNEFLRERYKTDAALRQAWKAGIGSAHVGSLPFPPKRSSRWEDVPALDLARFHLRLMTDWNRAHVSAIRSVDREHPITSEYYSTPFNGIDLRLTIDGQDVSNFGFFDRPERDLEVLPYRIRWNDLRSRGKSVGLGEYGVKTHPAWTPANGGRGYHIQRTRQEQNDLFMTVALCSFGMGASRVQNWCLRDANQRVFPWGVFYPGPLVPKDVAFIHRNMSLLLRLFTPRYRPPKLGLLLCGNMRLGNRANLGIDAGYHAFEALFGLHADFNVVSDRFLDRIPDSTKVLIYPSALCPNDATISRLSAWVRGGGRLLITGDFGYDANRRHTRAERLLELAGVEWVASRYAVKRAGVPAVEAVPTASGTAIPRFTGLRLQVTVRVRTARVLAATPDGTPVLTRNELGKGTVAFFADALELGDDIAAVRQLYAWFLGDAGVHRDAVDPDRPDLFLFRQPTRTGTAYVAMARTGKDTQKVRWPTPSGTVGTETRVGVPAFAAIADDGRVYAGCTTGEFRVGRDLLIQADGTAAAAALDGCDLRRSRAVLILPLSEGRIRVAAGRPGLLRRRTVLLGDIEQGNFRILERLPGGWGRHVSFTADADRATLFALCCPAAERNKWVQVLNRWIAAPEDMPGY